MSKTKGIILMAFVLALGAGVAVGMLGSRALPPATGGRARFVEELQLTPEQQKQIDSIWMESMSGRMHSYGEEFRAIQQQQETSCEAILTPEQKAQYDAIKKQSMQKMQDLWKRGQQDFDAATKKTRQILNETQQKKFDALISKFQSSGNKSGDSMWGMPTSAPTPVAQ